MTVNTYAKKWCEEDYDVRKEDFYVENAYYVASREWATSGFKHGWSALIVAIIVGLFNSATTSGLLLSIGTTLGILTVAFWFYGIRNYDANSIDTGLGSYVLIAIFLFITKNRVPEYIQGVFSILAFALYVYLSWVRPMRFFATVKRMKKRIAEEEAEEEKVSNDSYEKWKNSYKAYRYGLPNPDNPTSKEDPLMIEARKLFEGYTDTQQMLKARYRQLAKQHHPDKGGNKELFQCIIQIYEEIGQSFA